MHLKYFLINSEIILKEKISGKAYLVFEGWEDFARERKQL